MTSRERVLRAITFGSPDRIPVTHSFLPAALTAHGQELNAIYRDFPSDMEGQEGDYSWPADHPWMREGLTRDEWGSLWQNLGRGTEGQVVEHPLSDWANLAAYQPPDPDKVEWPEGKPRRGEKFLLGGCGGGRLFERMHFLRGYQELLEDIGEGRPEVERLLELVLDHTLRSLDHQLRYDVDMVAFMDDWGTQNALMIRPAKWRELFKPAYAAIIRKAHDSGKLFQFHSDGFILDIVDDLIEIGVDVFNPQLNCHPLEDLAEKCRGRVCLLTDLDRQHLIPNGTVADVVAEVEEIVRLFGLPSGGIIARVEVAPDSRMDNVRAVHEAFARWRPN